MRITRLLAPWALLLILLAPAPAPAGDHGLYQVSTINALLSGVYDGSVTVGELKARGDFGLGTFDGLEGEMIMLDGVVRQALVNGTVREMPDTARTPFAAVVPFRAKRKIRLGAVHSLDDLCQLTDSALPTPNIFYAVRVDGNFERVKVRSVPKQHKPYPPLAEVVKNGQAVFEYRDLPGTLVGLRSPEFAKGITVPGWHWHFLSKDATRGGHVLDCAFTSLDAAVAPVRNLELALPDAGGYDQAGLGHDRSTELNTVEKGR